MTARLRRALPGAVAAVVVVGVLVLVAVRFTGGAGGSGGYLVRAVFMNASFVTPGEQVKVAGVTVGTIRAVQLTEDNRAAVVLSIANRRFTPFRADAHCAIGLESLLGEQYVQCTPTQPRAAGHRAPPALPVIHGGAGNGEHLLGVANTTTPVGFDLLLDMNRLPIQERLRLLIAGLGTGLTANGHELNLALERADPTLQRTDQVIHVLAEQDRTIAQLTDASARILAPLAAQRTHLTGAISHSGAVAAAAASESRAIEANLHDLPAFLRQLRPAAARLARLADAATPSLTALRAHAGAIDTTIRQLGPLATRATPALTTLGTVAARATTVFPQAHAVAAQLVALATPLQPVATDLAATARSFDDAGGIEDVMRFIYYYTGAVNGEDSMGHYVRTLLELSNCSARSPSFSSSCSAKWSKLAAFASPEARRGETADATRSTAGTTAAARASDSIVATALREAGSATVSSGLRSLATYLLGR